MSYEFKRAKRIKSGAKKRKTCTKKIQNTIEEMQRFDGVLKFLRACFDFFLLVE